MRAARHQRHLDPGPGQPDREIAADRAGTVDADPHRAHALAPRPSFSARPMRCSFPVAPFGISSSSSKVRGTLKSASRFATNAFSRSEEHTSELQSLMRISYAVFCLKKKKKYKKPTQTQQLITTRHQ